MLLPQTAMVLDEKPKPSVAGNRRTEFPTKPRKPITVVLDGVRQNYNLGALFRLCDAFLVERLIICGTQVMLRKRKLVHAAPAPSAGSRGKRRPTPRPSYAPPKPPEAGSTAAELTPDSVPPTSLQPRYPAVLVLGAERIGISPDVVAMADQVVGIPMLGMANSLNVATAARPPPRQLTRPVRDPPHTSVMVIRKHHCIRNNNVESTSDKLQERRPM